jgi:hypothetical protein
MQCVVNQENQLDDTEMAGDRKGRRFLTLNVLFMYSQAQTLKIEW